MKHNSPCNIGALNLAISRYFASSSTLYLNSLEKPYPYLKSVNSKTELINHKVDSSNINEVFNDNILYIYLPSLSYQWPLFSEYEDMKHSNFSWSLFKLKLDLDPGYRYDFEFCLFNYTNDKNKELIQTNVNIHLNNEDYNQYFNLNLDNEALNGYNYFGYSPYFHADVQTNNRSSIEGDKEYRLDFTSKNMEWELCTISTKINLINKAYIPDYTGVLLIISRDKFSDFSQKYRTEIIRGRWLRKKFNTNKTDSLSNIKKGTTVKGGIIF